MKGRRGKERVRAIVEKEVDARDDGVFLSGPDLREE